MRSRLLAAVALSGHVPDVPEREIGEVVHKWWEGEIVPALNGGREAIRRDDVFALMEILHVVRDNFNSDLREAAPHFFSDLPAVQLLELLPCNLSGRRKRLPHPGRGAYARPAGSRAARPFPAPPN